VDPRAGLDAVAKRKILSPCRDSNPPIIQPVVQRYTTELSRLLILESVLKKLVARVWIGLSWFRIGDQ
jgi:hypothetical protein